MNFSGLDNALWAAGFAGGIALLFVLLGRSRWRQFPMFTCWIGYTAALTAALFLVSKHSSYHAYAVAYYAYVVGDFVLQLAVILEIARVVLRPTGTWVRDARSSFILWSSVGAVIALVLCWTVKPDLPSAFQVWVVRGNLFAALLVCQLFLAMLFASNRLGLEWRNHVMGLAQGLTAWALVAVASDIVHIALGWRREFPVLDHLLSFIWLGSLVYWIVTFWLPERERAPLSPKMREYLVALHSQVQYDLGRVNASRNLP